MYVNIPDTAFASDFTINGLVKKVSSTEYTKIADTTKSVNGIVKELKTKDSNIELKESKKSMLDKCSRKCFVRGAGFLSL